MEPVSTGERTLRNYIGGGWVDAAGEGTLDDIHPATGERVASIPGAPPRLDRRSR